MTPSTLTRDPLGGCPPRVYRGKVRDSIAEVRRFLQTGRNATVAASLFLSQSETLRRYPHNSAALAGCYLALAMRSVVMFTASEERDRIDQTLVPERVWGEFVPCESLTDTIRLQVLAVLELAEHYLTEWEMKP